MQGRCEHLKEKLGTVRYLGIVDRELERVSCAPNERLGHDGKAIASIYPRQEFSASFRVVTERSPSWLSGIQCWIERHYHPLHVADKLSLDTIAMLPQ
jgi:hypothetical protein